ncbi:cyclic AMP-dependent transcription factor ATF-6 alpha [Trichonephila clavata]|uniref:Cyclic AMP-dependent transcription factor ATF-6 alpha n=1 Tax=Trichonephila clavata TaxID=2740835 RepID=A0A8X6F8E5_TRICU|nr:cyclic AMP-dependent transcription factor ATF-6 alpha [Trichonephila clavata]
MTSHTDSGFNVLDDQNFDFNLLTDQDFQFETPDFLDLPLEEQNILENFSNELQCHNYVQSENQSAQLNGDSSSLDFVRNEILNSVLDDFLKESCKNNSISNELSSTYSMTTSENDVSVIHIPEENSNCPINGVLSETPPQTPPDFIEQVPNSSPIIPSNPIVVSLAVPNVTYVFPPPISAQPVITPPKICKKIQPRLNGSNPETQITQNVSSIHTNIVKDHDYSSEPSVTLLSGISQTEESRSNASVQNGLLTKPKRKRTRLPQNPEDRFRLVEERREQKKAKNREYALLSRLRKLEYVMKIEEELNQVAAENTTLKEENCRLKHKIIDLENEILKLKAAFTSKPMKKTVCLMVAVFMLTFNFASFGSIFERNKPVKVNTEDHRVGRILLWNEENTSREVNSSTPMQHDSYIKEDDAPYIVSWDNSYNTSSCLQFINKSESLRLENDLLGWVHRVERKQKQKESKMKKNDVNMKSTIPPLPKLQQLGSRYKNEINKDIWAKRKNRNEILIYQTPRKDYEDFFDAIHRRDDSFYFISFSGDHLLLPAIAHNQTLRPRMSFVMPAMILDDSMDDADDHISMMQIDCEVMDTKLVHIKESVIPPHLRQKHNISSKTHSKNYSKYSVNRNSKQINGTVKLSNKSSENG